METSKQDLDKYVPSDSQLNKCAFVVLLEYHRHHLSLWGALPILQIKQLLTKDQICRFNDDVKISSGL